MMAKAKMRTLNFRLLRDGLEPNDAFIDKFAEGEPSALRKMAWDSNAQSFLFVGQIYKNNDPAWMEFLRGHGGDLPTDLVTGGAGAILFFLVNGRYVCVCFGQVHIALDDDAFERQFGLKVTLNVVPRNGIRSMDLATPDAITFQKRIQASKDSDVQSFGVDRLRDIARVAGGTPADASFARFVAGKDSLSLSCPIEIEDLEEKCAKILIEYQKEDYLREYPWVGNLKPIIEKTLIRLLDGKLFDAVNALRSGGQSDLHMAPPEIVDYTDGAQLHYNGFGSHGAQFHTLSIDDYVSELKRCNFDGDMKAIKTQHKVRAKITAEDEYSKPWRVYDCFVFETELKAGDGLESYVLFAGQWFKVNKSFKNEVETFYASIPRSNIIGSTSCRNEKELISDLEANRKDLVKLDLKKINPKGVRYANLEPCDYFSDKSQFIHLKDGESSGPISHLWNQGVVSARAFLSDSKYRKDLHAFVKKENKIVSKLLPDGKVKRVNGADYSIVYGVMRKPYADGTLGLPFFSKVSLQSAMESLQPTGMQISLELIRKN